MRNLAGRRLQAVSVCNSGIASALYVTYKQSIAMFYDISAWYYKLTFLSVNEAMSSMLDRKRSACI